MAHALIVVVTHNSARDVERCLASLGAATGDGAAQAVLVVDNASSDDTVERIRTGFPWVELREAGSNLGFAAGNNLALSVALERGLDFVYLLNPDTEVEPEFLTRAVAVAESDPEIAAVQSLLLLDPERQLIDSAGNRLHFLGFGYCGLYRQPRAMAPSRPVEIAFASGAAVLIRVEALRRVGPLREELFLYCEDLDFGWRLRLAGFRIVLASDSVVYHRHEFGRAPDKYFLLERNRFLVLLANYSVRSLLVLGPLLAANELALWTIAFLKGWWRAKLRASLALLDPRLWRPLRGARQRAQALRRLPDRAIASHFTATMEFEGVTGPFVRRLANPLLELLWRLARHCL